MKLLLLGLKPPENILTKVICIQNTIYKKWGLVSPLALPAIIPLFFLPAGFKLPPEKHLKESVGWRFFFTTGNIIHVSGHLFWEVSSSGALAQFKTALKGLCPSIPAEALNTPFPEFEGFYLASREDSSSLKDIVKLLNPPARQLFPATAISVIKVESLSLQDKQAPAAPWYEGVQWEEQRLLTLRKL